MYRFSNGLIYTGKSELSRPYIIFNGNKTNDIVNDGWNLIKVMPDKTRVYFSKYLGELHIFKQPIDDSFFYFLEKELDSFDINLKHPVLSFPIENELERLYPKVDKDVAPLFNDFISFLNKEYDFEKKLSDEKDLCTYSDDIGPFLCSKVGIQKVLVPEISNLYLAPKIWRYLTWIINNNFAGPLPINDKNIYYSWGDLKINNKFKNSYCEGSALFLIAKFIIIHQAWVGNNSCDALKVFFDLLIKKNINPYKLLLN